MDDWIYLDYNASTPVAREVKEAFESAFHHQAHPSSKHPHGRQAATLVLEARRQVAEALGAERPEEIIFCSGSTEASNQAIKGVAFAQRDLKRPRHFVCSQVEHPATDQPLEFLRRLGHRVTRVPVDENGCVKLTELERALETDTLLVTMIHAQNETGTVQPLAEVGRICRQRGVLFHVDASQSFGKVPVDVNQLGADLLNIAGHKIYAPKGVGALYVREGVELEPLLHGGGHERGLRSGTPAPQLIAALGRACSLVCERGPVPAGPAERLWQRLSSALGDRVRRNGSTEQRVPNVLHLTFQGLSGSELLDQARVCASTGAACHSAAMSPVLKALGFTPAEAAGTVRLSTGWDTTTEEAERAAERLILAYQELTQKEVVS